jgi:hypothetical protein
MVPMSKKIRIYFVKAAWDAVEFVHGYCFNEFSDDLNFQHLFIEGMNAIFRHGVENRGGK